MGCFCYVVCKIIDLLESIYGDGEGKLGVCAPGGKAIPEIVEENRDYIFTKRLPSDKMKHINCLEELNGRKENFRRWQGIKVSSCSMPSALCVTSKPAAHPFNITICGLTFGFMWIGCGLMLEKKLKINWQLVTSRLRWKEEVRLLLKRKRKDEYVPNDSCYLM